MDDYFIRELQSYDSPWRGHVKFAVELVKEINPITTVELGVDYGYSIFAFAYKNNGTVYGVDSFEGDQHAGYRNALPELLKRCRIFKDKFDINNIVIIKSDFTSLSKSWQDKIDILHIDGGHRYEDVHADYYNWKRYLHYDSIVLFHDVDHFEDVKRCFDEISGLKFIIHGSEGLGVLCFNDTMYERLIDLNKKCS